MTDTTAFAEGFFLDIAVIVVFPAFFAVTLPEPETTAILLFLEIQDTFEEASAGFTF